MSLRNRHLLLSTVITTLVITLTVLTFYFFTGGNSFYDAGRFLLFTGIVLTVIVVPLFYRSHHRARLHIYLHLPVEERNRIISDPYYDYFAGVAFGTVLTVALSFGVIALASTLEGRRSSSTNVPLIGSVKSELPNLYKAAYEWHSDADLAGLDYSFGRREMYRSYIISAEFRSLSEPDELLVVEISTEGKYINNYFDIPPSANWIPISDKNWTIDSQEAVSIFAQDRAVRACLTYDREKILELTQKYSMERHVKWCLHIDECAAIDRVICIDAVTGEYLPLE